ncbi:predicted phosphate binding protein PstS [Malacoplasma penetrans HF-2]|uniref:Predicted phosphate binding protein PstS n=1 Tax=Malacoplasma penetrans (strain HF-2) TaxID=272633 RepID=Q8EUI9_MALP2|nr:substrate-binding domain-containing protein [Malacoplasma penetrans]BAC44724.1 predicted phosphate binding protein PstS [Malacoplasma penetrans HF-2]
MGKYLKIITSTVAIAVPVATITYFSVPWNPRNILTLVGSSSLQPLMTSLSNAYTNSDLIVQGGGSGFGIQSVAKGTADIGLASKDPYSSVRKATIQSNDYTKEDWTNKNLKTFTVAFDSIAIVYKTSDKSDQLKIDSSMMQNYIYPMFAGTKTVKIKDLIPSSTDESVFVPYGRTGGADASGTATSFLTQYQNYKPDTNSVEYEILNSGAYRGNVRSTNESNVEAWNKIHDENLNGGIIYLSLSFVLENYKTITDSGYSVATVNGQNPYTAYSTNNNSLNSDFLSSYNWFSLYNIIVPLNDVQKIRDFMEWLYFGQESQNIINGLALVSASSNNSYLQSMLYDNTTSTTIDKNNFISTFWEVKDGKYINSDGNIASKNNWDSNGAFGIPNSAIKKSQQTG